MAAGKGEDLVGTLYHKIKELILEGRLSPGEKIVQDSLAEELGVSRTPLMRALMLLEGDMLVKSLPRRGIIVRKLELQELRDAFQLRASVESMCAGLAAEHATKKDIARLKAVFAPFRKNPNLANPKEYQRADQQFHSLIMDISGNLIVRQMPLVANIIQLTYQRGLVRYPHQTYNDHMRIIEAIEARDPEKARKAMLLHLQKSIEVVEQHMSEERK